MLYLSKSKPLPCAPLSNFCARPIQTRDYHNTMFPGFGRSSTDVIQYTRSNKQQGVSQINTWAQAQNNGFNRPRTANPNVQVTDQRSPKRIFSPLRRTVSKGTHGASCPQGCMPIVRRTGEILHYIPNAGNKVPGYEQMDSHYVLILDGTYKSPQYRDHRDWFACLVISTHPPPDLEHRLLRPKTEPCQGREYSPHLSTHLFDRMHCLCCKDTPYCTHVTKGNYDRKLWRPWDWFGETRISIEAPKMVHRKCLHVLRPLTPTLGVSMTDKSMTLVRRQIAAQLATKGIKTSNGVTKDYAMGGNANYTWSELMSN